MSKEVFSRRLKFSRLAGVVLIVVAVAFTTFLISLGPVPLSTRESVRVFFILTLCSLPVHIFMWFILKPLVLSAYVRQFGSESDEELASRPPSNAIKIAFMVLLIGPLSFLVFLRILEGLGVIS